MPSRGHCRAFRACWRTVGREQTPFCSPLPLLSSTQLLFECICFPTCPWAFRYDDSKHHRQCLWVCSNDSPRMICLQCRCIPCCFLAASQEGGTAPERDAGHRTMPCLKRGFQHQQLKPQRWTSQPTPVTPVHVHQCLQILLADENTKQ